ncbi:MAG TPA: radical SAM protein [Thermoanaerobaculia bacterium]|nr:radical SAM protein [Thermoanaerobaculia bacterium]
MDVTIGNGRARVVMWELTRACKLGCVHCPIGAQPRRSPLELTTYEAYKTIDQIVAMNPNEVIITGGDPFERPDLYQLIDYAHRRGMNPSLTVSVTPSLTGAAIGKLKRNGLGRLVISLDSARPDKHDAGRGIAGQFGSTLLAIRWARTAELPVEVNTLLDRSNPKELQTIAELLADVEVARWNIYFLVPVGNAKSNETLTAEEVEQVFEQIHGLSRRTRFPIRTFEAPHYRRFVLQKAVEARLRTVEDYFDVTADGLRIGDDTGDAAVAVNNYLYISHTGEISVSPFLPLTAGNVRYQPLPTIHQYGELFAAVRDEVNLKGKCGRCEFKSVCGGSRARAFALTGDLFAADPLCAFQPGTFLPVAPMAAPRGDI